MIFIIIRERDGIDLGRFVLDCSCFWVGKGVLEEFALKVAKLLTVCGDSVGEGVAV